MLLEMATGSGVGYKSACQIARRVTEEWGEANLYCAACSSESIDREPPNTRAIDFRCPRCAAGYQLKASRIWNERRIPDAGFDAMMGAITRGDVPNLLVMHYTADWRVNQLLLVPSFAFSASAVEKRKPLSASARRAGWVGCNILLGAIPDLAKLRVVEQGRVSDCAVVRRGYEKLRPLAEESAAVRGWTLDVLRVVQALPQDAFNLAEVYAEETTLSDLHPENRNVRPKIRQQLQVLRDLGLVEFLGSGEYRRL